MIPRLPPLAVQACLAADPACRQAVIYARVSSKEQEKEGFSIPAQLKLLNEYAAAQGLMIAREYVDVETAKQTGRAGFGEMVAYLKGHSAVRVLLVEKTDRLYRNLKDWVTVDDLAARRREEGPSCGSRPSEKRCTGTGEYGPCDPAQSALRRCIRVERSFVRGYTSTSCLAGALGASAGRARWPPSQQTPSRKAQ